MKRVLFLTAFFLITRSVYPSGTYTQTIRGTVLDKETRAPIAFANVAVFTEGKSLGTITNENGHFRIDYVPIGRAELLASFIGYESINIKNLDVTTGKEMVVDIEMNEAVIKLESVEIRAKANKESPLNPYAATSARTFSVEEAQRYASSYSDISRLAMNFAGVKSTDDTQNEIVIRGNSPMGMLFRLDGIDIPNPNHFGDGGATGGIVSMLNVNVMANSDFLTGAFPAEYGNTLSGVFDLKMRNGNNEKHEFIGQLSLMGTELGAEGPVSREKGSSYLFNYRYSTVELLNAVVDLKMGTSLPSYQDGSFKLNFPSRGRGTTTLTGFGGKHTIALLDSPRDTSVAKPGMTAMLPYDTDEYIDSHTGVLGLSHLLPLGEKAYLKVILSASTITNRFRTDSLSTDDRQPVVHTASHFRRTRYAARTFVNKKFDSRNSLKAGFSVELQDYSLNDSTYERETGTYRTLREFSGQGYLVQPYLQWQHRLNAHFRFNAGLASVWQSVSGHISFEPRLGASWEPLQGNTFSLAYGLHSYATPLEVLQQQVFVPGEGYLSANSKLGFTESHHFVAGYDKVYSGKLRLKSEVYYQHIRKAPVEKASSPFSMLNRGSSTAVDFGALHNQGSGFNYGMELTAEKFMDKGSYFLSTLSVYESKCRGSDGVLRNTAFNGNYVFNILAGKEYAVGSSHSKNRKKVNIDGKFNIAGGQRFSPIDLEASRLAGMTRYDETNAWSVQMPVYMTSQLRAGLKIAGPLSTKELALGISNLTNRRNVFSQYYDTKTDAVKTAYQFGIMPDLLFRIVF